MKLAKFFQTYDSEISCLELFKSFRDRVGVICKRCGCCNHYWLGTRDRYRCKQCKWETTLRSGTSLEYSKLPYTYWMHALAFMCNSKKPVSALEMQLQLDHPYYTPIWTMMHKLRVIMGQRELLYVLREFLEPGDLSFEVSDNGRDSIEQFREVSQKARVSIQAQVVAFGGRCGKGSYKFLKLASEANLEDLNRPAGMYDVFDLRSVRRKSVVLKQCECKRREPELEYKNRKGIEVSGHQRWVNIMISNAKRNIRGVYHSVKTSYLQNYLNEFCYMTNRRYSGQEKFNNLLCLVASKAWYLPYVQASADSGG